ncbi:MAG: Rpn family recombination-promoting nuclease/putative transposase [Spirochaetota bacterium]
MRIGIKPTIDLVFKMIFGSPRHSFLTLHFLNDLLPLVHRPQAASVTITNPFRLAEFRTEKEITVDVRAQDETRRDFQIEMQVRADGAPSSRMHDTWARIYTEQIRRGESYLLHRPVISVWILGGDLYPEPQWLHCVQAVRDSSGKPCGEEFLIVVIELRKRAALPDFGDEAMFRTGIDRWLALLWYGQDIDPESPRFRGLDADIQEAAMIMDLFIKSKRARWAYDRRMDWISRVKDWHIVDRAEGRAEGLAEGEAKGLAEGAVKTARRLKGLGIDPAIIVEGTGLTAEEVERA